MSDTPRPLITTSEIAYLAGVDVSTVSNWRRRFDGSFPEPAPTADAGKRPKFDRAEILEWLTQNPRVGAPRSTPVADLFAVLDGFRGLFPVDSAMDVVGAIAVLVEYHRRNDVPINTRSGEAIRRACRGDGLSSDILELVRVDLLDLLTDRDLEALQESIEPVADLLALYDSLLLRSVNRLSGSAEQTTPDLLSSFLLSLAEDNPHGTIYDPAAGYAGLLLAALKQNKAGVGVGVDINDYAERVARRRLYLAQANGTILWGNSLLMDPARSTLADLVLTDPPLGLALAEQTAEHRYPAWEFGTPPKSNSDTAWLQHAISHLKPEGRAIVVTAIGTLFRGGRDGVVRNELVRRGAVQAVIALPGKVRANTSIRLAVWVLATPDKVDRRQSVLLIDAGANDLSTLDPAGPIVRTFTEWMKDPAVELDPALAVSVAVTELLAPDVTLDPKRWLVNPAEELTATEWVDVAKTGYGVAVASLTAQQVLPSVTFSPVQEAPRKDSLGDLQRRGVVNILHGRHVERTLDESMTTYPILTVKHVRPHADLQSLPTERTPQTESTATQLVAPGDVVIYPVKDSVIARVWTEPGWVLGRFMQSIRINDSRVLTADYLAAAISSPTNARFLTESTIRTHFDLKQFEIATPSLEVQTALSTIASQLAATLTEVEAKARALRAAQLAVSNSITSGLIAAVVE